MRELISASWTSQARTHVVNHAVELVQIRVVVALICTSTAVVAVTAAVVAIDAVGSKIGQTGHVLLLLCR